MPRLANPRGQSQTDDLDIRIQATLKRIWGFDELRPLQSEVVHAALANRDAVIVMPTGGGKSLCYQLPAIVSERLTVVVSPLIALMKDQVDSLRVVGVSAAALNSSLDDHQANEVRRQLAAGELRLLYISPERLLQLTTLQMLEAADRGKGVARFAIDEAHCISGWGHDFRPEFRQLNRIKNAFPGVPVMAFTATATPQVQRDIAIQLGLERPRKFVGGFDRPNLTYRVVAKDDAVRRTIEAVRRYPDEGVIVYCLSRKDTESITAALIAQGIPAVSYHAGLSPETRKSVSEAFGQERANIVVATVAFGMGIDRANVRCVIHECLPKSIEGYQQETGRAGRDGLPSECVLLYNHGDVVRLKRLLLDEDTELNAHRLKLLEEVRRFATSLQCRHKLLSEHFGQLYELAPEGCGACDVCLGGTQVLADSTGTGLRILDAVRELKARRGSPQFGVSFLVSVLVGSRIKTVRDRQADEATCFGAFENESADRVSSWVHQILDLNLLSVTEGQYPTLDLTPEGETTLDGRLTIKLVENVAMLAPAKEKRSKTATSLPEDADTELYERLRSWRRKISGERKVPAYVIFHDATLMALAAARPTTLNGIRALSGVGERRAAEFGTALIDLITAYGQETGITLDRPDAKQFVSPPEEVSAKASATYFPYFQKGASVEETARACGVKPSTVWGYLATWVITNRPATLAPWVDQATFERVSASLSAEDSGQLKPVFESLGGNVSYDIIRLVRNFCATHDQEFAERAE